jgi:hypothetical protein
LTFRFNRSLAQFTAAPLESLGYAVRHGFDPIRPRVQR